ncbi:hypothetical protein QWJ26_13410 [Streptomyces sp. CSDS2]|uniref:hypothetical protein n=1 Tax=Streptomyces sp. CSDS2 TaxID=3055051 RepID=UPI0025B26F0C|nr:hypothetical protein [Streptomyces sp. CSDS2]MDN3260793.1 hypothetical protein [Streptomyces sp. CSDS2]
MTRTPGDLSRRRSINDVASGFPSRTRVALYACIAPGQDQADVLEQLRLYAEARDWVVVGEVIDHTPTATPLDSRPNWPQAKVYITTGEARGIVATPHTRSAGAGSSPTLTEWLHDQNAFLSDEALATERAAR